MLKIEKPDYAGASCNSCKANLNIIMILASHNGEFWSSMTLCETCLKALIFDIILGGVE